MQPYFLLCKCSLPSFFRTHGRTYKRQALDTTRKDDAGRNSIYQRLVNRLAHVPGGDRGCSEVGKEERGGRWRSQWPSGTWRWRPQNENQKLQFIAGTANFPDFASSLPLPFSLYPSSLRATSPAALAGGQRRSLLRGGATTPVADYTASHVPSSWDSCSNWQADHAFNCRNRIAKLERRAFRRTVSHFLLLVPPSNLLVILDRLLRVVSSTLPGCLPSIGGVQSLFKLR